MFSTSGFNRYNPMTSYNFANYGSHGNRYGNQRSAFYQAPQSYWGGSSQTSNQSLIMLLNSLLGLSGQNYKQSCYSPQPSSHYPNTQNSHKKPQLPHHSGSSSCKPPVQQCPPAPPKCPPPQTPQCPEPPVQQYPPAPPECPPQEQNKVLGSAGLFGDPQFGLFTPGIQNVPNALKGFESNIKNGQTVNLLNDPDKGGFSISATGTQVDPRNAASTGIGEATFKSGNDTVQIKGNGDLYINGVKKGNINDAGLISPIQLANGMTVSTAQEIDNAQGGTAERFVISNGEYKVTAAARKPHPDSAAYLDMNFQELTANAADNATGYRTTVPGLNQQFGIVDLLRLEPGAFAASV
jgi:hypothetical protein